jgi:hypothetical protein
MIIVQYGIKKYESENMLVEKLKSILSEKDIQRSIDTLIGTQKVRRIGPEVIQNNESHTELPDIPDNLKLVIDSL